jgi:chromate transporter
MTDSNTLAVPPAPTLGEALRFWLKLGFISFGGPAGQISIMHQELVERRRWISEHRFLHALNYCMVLPGPEACQLAIYTGWLLHGLSGGLMAGLLFFLPAFFAALAAGRAVPGLRRPAVGAGHLLRHQAGGGCRGAVRRLAHWLARDQATPCLLAIAALAFVGIFFFKIEFPWIVLAAGVLGAIGGKLLPGKFASRRGSWRRARHYGPALIDDDTPPPAHARFTWFGKLVATTHWRFVCHLARPRNAGAARQCRSAFTWANSSPKRPSSPSAAPTPCCLTSIRAPWSSSAGSPGRTMMDGLALGETTPGPLIMIVTWVGYVGGVTKAVAGRSGRVSVWPVRRWRPSSPFCRASCSSSSAARWWRPRAAN